LATASLSAMKRLGIYMQMLFNYQPRRFWNELLSDSFDLRGVGHYRLSEAENRAMYDEKRAVIERELAANGIAIGPDSTVLEIGVGVGYWTEFLKSLGVRRYTGNDIAQVSVERLGARYPEFTFVHGDAGDVALPAGTFDVAFMIDVTQHITDDGAFGRAMRNVWAAIKPGGAFLVTFWDPGTNKFLSTKLRLNRIEKPRGAAAYLAAFGPGATIASRTPFNDKHLLVVKKR
jgi:SAM-dependent methyltransferase